MIKKRVIVVISAVLLISIAAFAITYSYLDTKITGNSIRVVRAPSDAFYGTIASLPESIEIITEEEFLLAMEEEDTEITDEHIRLYIESFFNPENQITRFVLADLLEEQLVFKGIDDYIYERAETSARVYNVLFIGDDARIHQDRGRSDTMILISYNRDTRTIHLTSFMRDILIPVNPGGTLWNRLNSLHAVGGPGRTINVLNNLFSLDIQRYAVVRFSGVFELVDALGGLELNLTADEAAVINGIFPDFAPVSEGLNLLNGRQVLAYSRIRVIDNDFVRTQRQRYVLSTLIDELLDTTSIGDIITIANFVLDHVETNVPLSEIITLGFDLLTGSRPVVKELRIPVDGSFNHGRFYGAYILAIDFMENVAALHEFIYASSADISSPADVSAPDVTLYDMEQEAALPAEPAEDA
ncbi:MAG: LCP family protein [Spirochaetes bacterium]|nr:LCP family protein [Spirochaetota bacterium]